MRERRIKLTPRELEWAGWAIDPMSDYWDGLVTEGEEEEVPPLPTIEDATLLMPDHDGVIADFLERLDLARDVIEEDPANVPPWPKEGLNERGKAELRAVRSLAKKILMTSTRQR